MFRNLLTKLCLPLLAVASVVPEAAAAAFTNVTIFAPPRSWSSHATAYARSILINDNGTDVLYATWIDSPPGLPYLPLYKSTDGGQTWANYSSIYFKTTAKGGILFQPFLYELPEQLGQYPAGTILAAVNAVPNTFSSTNIEIQASLDKG
jgi:hypothetical protein